MGTRGCLVMASLAVLVLAGCGRAAGGGGGPAGTASAAAVAPPSDAVGTVTAGDADNGRTLTLSVGDKLVVRLASTYWRFSTPAGGGPLVGLGPAEVTASPPGAGCVPGAGCGAVVATFRAVLAGQETVSADRTTCGEAMRCTGGAGTYRLYLVVR